MQCLLVMTAEQDTVVRRKDHRVDFSTRVGDCVKTRLPIHLIGFLDGARCIRRLHSAEAMPILRIQYLPCKQIPYDICYPWWCSSKAIFAVASTETGPVLGFDLEDRNVQLLALVPVSGRVRAMAEHTFPSTGRLLVCGVGNVWASRTRLP